ncbi:MAG: hypothetical protein IPO32_11560 [Crocinitomicaceae bacterium]|nr:hypothetical protein [Crocinitomicaceae bacterium]
MPYTKLEFCKSSEVEIINGDLFPVSHVILGISSFFLRDAGASSIETLSPNLIKKMKRLAVYFNSCKVFVDFINAVGGFTDIDGDSLDSTHIHYFIIRPLYYLQ